MRPGLAYRECGSPLARDHQHRRLPLGDVVDRVPLLELLRSLVIGVPAVLPLVEPQLFGLVGHGAGIEHTVMLHEALEAVRPYAGDPVHHIAAIGSTCRAGIVAVDLPIERDRSGKALLQVFQWLSAPLAGDGGGKSPALSRWTLENNPDQ